MWKLKIAEGKGPYLFSTNNYVGKQIWEFDPDARTPEERKTVEQTRQAYKDNFKKDRTRAPSCADLLMRMQLKKENKNIDLSIAPVRLGETEEVNNANCLQLKKENKNIDLNIPAVRLGETEEVKYEAVTIALKKAIRLNGAIQSSDGHWPVENASPCFSHLP
ncbi:hypothetical protein RHSIM_Rhsim03G0094800 [Rhododendron simsii]|uniref:Beta-amyrin synthase n=1 Tax=Rhododendron simsii TaxID=118357 RepID=A0A834LR77_RHOSS|nr:hypothetical protein RHSIM_Rhsim03G0094800 [Rhododendron simsii]